MNYYLLVRVTNVVTRYKAIWYVVTMFIEALKQFLAFFSHLQERKNIQVFFHDLDCCSCHDKGLAMISCLRYLGCVRDLGVCFVHCSKSTNKNLTGIWSVSIFYIPQHFHNRMPGCSSTSPLFHNRSELFVPFSLVRFRKKLCSRLRKFSLVSEPIRSFPEIVCKKYDEKIFSACDQQSWIFSIYIISFRRICTRLLNRSIADISDYELYIYI